MRPIAAAALAGLVAVPAVAQDDDPVAAKDPEAVEIVNSAMAYLRDHDSVAVDWFVSFDEVVDGREKLTFLRSGTNLLVRGQGVYAYAEMGEKTREYRYDGTTLSIVDPVANAYAQTLLNGSFENMVDKVRAEYDLHLPIWSVLSRSFDGYYTDAAEQVAYVGWTRVAGEGAHHIALSNYDSDWQVWISDDADAPRLLMMVGTDPYSQGWPQYRAYFQNWDFAPEVPEGIFQFVPDENADRMSWPRVLPGQED
ncbi:DUF2092 domain-containing protein [Shimia biformata]|uniref:DUF2092 domain-containing protein n=1 Tax=Shimia biformata TaxID=1294299 RepID=UPI00194FEC0A|nr:DUF2092 domain-containing protein [Shimia biformata]